MALSLRAYYDENKGLLLACYMFTLIASVIVAWTLYARRYILLIFPWIATVIWMASMAVLFFVFAFLRSNRGRPAYTFKALEARVQRISRPFLRVTEEDLVAATANFSQQKIIGRGRFGMVYRGILSNGKVVAIKRVKSSPLAKSHFLSELHILGQLRHRNLLRILGYFHNDREMILLSKFMPNLSLHIRLHGPYDCRLDWRQRLKILMGVASGLEYLHHGLRNAIVHCHLKPANILLDEHLEPHIADFGLAQLIGNNQSTQSSLVPSFAFTVGYTAPERAFLGVKTSSKADVYSYGILLLELISGLKPTSSTLMEMGVTISQLATSAVSENNCIEFMDSCLKTVSEFHSEIQRVLRIGIHCTHESPEMRPSMKDVAKSLEEIIGKRRWDIPLYVLAHQELQMQDSAHTDSHFTSD